MLFGTMAEAEMLKSFIDSAGCGEVVVAIIWPWS